MTTSPATAAALPAVGGRAVGVVPGADAALRWVRTQTDTARDNGERVDRLRTLEELKSAICAEQAQLAVALDAATRSEQESVGLPSAQRGRGVAAQVALARRESPHRGQVLLGLAKVLVDEMPRTQERLADGTLSEWAATCLVKETACLSLADRMAVDEQLCADPETIDGWGVRRLTAEARLLAQRLDAAACVKRAAKARQDRCVTLRPAPDTMTYLTALLPVEQGVAAYAALCRAADTVVATGAPDEQPRSRGQVMADTLVELVTGQSSAAEVPLRVNVVISDASLVACGDGPATFSGRSPMPAGLARSLIRAGLDCPGRTQLRRLYAHPTTGQLVTMESRSRLFPKALGEFLELRDQTCRTPWCDAPVRHHDHVTPHAEGGPTSGANGQGLCEACNHAKQAPGWSAQTAEGPPDSGHVVQTTTPTGHTYRSRAPDLRVRRAGPG